MIIKVFLFMTICLVSDGSHFLAQMHIYIWCPPICHVQGLLASFFVFIFIVDNFLHSIRKLFLPQVNLIVTYLLRHLVYTPLPHPLDALSLTGCNSHWFNNLAASSVPSDASTPDISPFPSHALLDEELLPAIPSTPTC